MLKSRLAKYGVSVCSLLWVLIATAPTAPAATVSSVPVPPALRAALYRQLPNETTATHAFGAASWTAQEVNANDGAPYDDFGYAVAISGNTALIGAPNAEIDGRFLQGAVYVFTESNGTWSQAQKLTASDGTNGDNFGYAVAFDGDTAIIGAPQAAAYGPGAAYVFVQSGGTWTQTQKMLSPYPRFEERFGAAVALSGHVMLVSAPGDTGGDEKGCVYGYLQAGNAWAAFARITANDASTGDFFGVSVALDRYEALIGAPGAGAGAAYLEAPTGNGLLQTKLTANDGAADDYFGRSVAVHGSEAVVGAPNATVNGLYAEGAVYVFGKAGGAWSQTQKLTPPSADASDWDIFGFSLAISGPHLLVGAYGVGAYSGAAYLFGYGSGSWSLSDSFYQNGIWDNRFGTGVALDGTNLLIGANPSAPLETEPGAAYFYHQ